MLERVKHVIWSKRNHTGLLKNLGSVKWSKLTNDDGSAAKVPDLIRDLASEHWGDRAPALRELYFNVCHDGIRYQAAAYAIPFLYELIASPKIQDRHEIVYLLVNLALDYEGAYLPDGIDAPAFRRELELKDSQMSLADRAKYERAGIGPRVDLDCYDAARSGVPVLIASLTDDDARLRRAAAYALAWFPEEASASLPAMRRLLAAESDDIDVANALMALGLLARSSYSTANESEWHGYLPHASLIVRVAAAIALARDPLTDEIIKVLVEGVLATGQLQGRDEDTRFNDGKLSGYAGRVLARHGKQARQKIIPALCDALESVNFYESLDITGALLEVIVSGKTTLIKDTPASSLDETEICALRAIAGHGGWKWGRGGFLDYSVLVRGYGLPDSQEGLIEYLKQAGK